MQLTVSRGIVQTNIVTMISSDKFNGDVKSIICEVLKRHNKFLNNNFKGSRRTKNITFFVLPILHYNKIGIIKKSFYFSCFKLVSI